MIHFRTNNEDWTLEFVEKIDDEGTMGYCDHHSRRIMVRTGMTERETLSTVLHEAKHVLDPNNILSEEYVTKTDWFLSKLLMDLGYRRVPWFLRWMSRR